MIKHIKKITLISILQLILIIMIMPSITSQYSNSITIEGFVYLNNVKIIPDQVSLILPDEMRYATIFENGKYQIILPSSEQITGTFLIIYQNNPYDGSTITIVESLDYYENDIYITIGSGDNEAEPIADAGGPYYRVINENIFFDGSASYDPDGIITIFEWDFGDGSTGSGVTPIHTYSSVGNYTVTLIVTDNENKTDLDITFVYIEEELDEIINIQPNADAGGPYYQVINENIFFDGLSSYDPDGIITIFEWDFGDGSTGSGVTPIHTYSSVGNYTVTLIVTDDEGKTNFDITHANISETSNDPTNIQPIADAGGPYDGIINIPIKFNGSQSYDSDGTIVEYLWDFGDGHIGNGEIVTHEYNNEGIYDLSLKVSDNNYDFNINYSYVVITDKPNSPPNKPDISGASSISINKLENYSAKSNDPDGDDIRYFFDWGDGTLITETEKVLNGTIVQSNHSWSYPGLYQLTVYVEDEKGETSENTVKNILVDSQFCSNIGFLIDYTNDGVYDIFHSNTTSNKTTTILEQNEYLIDTDGDKNWDYIFDAITGSLSSYSKTSNGIFGIENIFIVYIGVFAILILAIFIIIYFYNAIKKKTDNKSIYFTKERKTKHEIKDETTSEKKLDSTDIKLDEIEKRIDELIGKK